MIYTNTAELRAFIMMALTMPNGPTLEMCYYDRVNHQFFQVKNYDLLLDSEDFNERYTTDYTSEQQQVLTSYVKRLLSEEEGNERCDFIQIERLALSDRLMIQEMFVGGTLLEPDGELMKLIATQNEETVFIIEPALLARQDKKFWTKWEDFRISMLDMHVDRFLKYNFIILD